MNRRLLRTTPPSASRSCYCHVSSKVLIVERRSIPARDFGYALADGAYKRKEHLVRHV
jgi:hypothetical protein